jgi:hypothetical protein
LNAFDNDYARNLFRWPPGMVAEPAQIVLISRAAAPPVIFNVCASATARRMECAGTGAPLVRCFQTDHLS